MFSWAVPCDDRSFEVWLSEVHVACLLDCLVRSHFRNCRCYGILLFLCSCSMDIISYLSSLFSIYFHPLPAGQKENQESEELKSFCSRAITNRMVPQSSGNITRLKDVSEMLSPFWLPGDGWRKMCGFVCICRESGATSFSPWREQRTGGLVVGKMLSETGSVICPKLCHLRREEWVLIKDLKAVT